MRVFCSVMRSQNFADLFCNRLLIVICFSTLLSLLQINVAAAEVANERKQNTKSNSIISTASDDDTDSLVPSEQEASAWQWIITSFNQGNRMRRSASSRNRHTGRRRNSGEEDLG